jgi:SSS family solute:Na+ symporter
MLLVDWIIVGLFIGLSIVIGLYFSREAARGKDEFFLAGRSLGWFVAGTSIVATTFSSDTPQWVAGLARSQGIAGNWLWWSAAIGQVGAVFLLARYWRRSELVTEVEFIHLRYGSGITSSCLRVFRAVFDGVLVNCVIMASVTLAMAKILAVVLNLSDQPLTVLPFIGEVTSTGIVLALLTLFVIVYCSVSGLYGVVYTDLFQFVIAMTGSIVLAVVMYVDAASGPGMLEKLQASPHFTDNTLDIIPNLTTWNAASFTFLMYVGVVWFLNFPTTGFHVQRLLSTRDENQAMRAFLWYNFANYVLRSWPWIVVGVLGLIYYPELTEADSEKAYAMAVADFLPTGLKGLMVAAFLAAYMSTLSTHLNWGTSYLVNDVYLPYVHPKASSKVVVVISRCCLLVLAVIAAVIATKLTRMLDAYKFLYVLWAGVGTVLVARWYWWRVTAGAEVLAIGVTILLGWILHAPTNLLPGSLAVLGMVNLSPPAEGMPACQPALESLLQSMGVAPSTDEMAVFCIRVMLVTLIPAIVWIPYVLVVSQFPSAEAIAFYRKLRICGRGWRRVADECGLPLTQGEFRLSIACWVTACVFMYGCLVAIGSLIFQQWLVAGVASMVSIGAGVVLVRLLRNYLRMSPLPRPDNPPKISH